MITQTIEDFFPSIHNDDLILIGETNGIPIYEINHRQAQEREEKYLKSLIEKYRR